MSCPLKSARLPDVSRAILQERFVESSMTYVTSWSPKKPPPAPRIAARHEESRVSNEMMNLTRWFLRWIVWKVEENASNAFARSSCHRCLRRLSSACQQAATGSSGALVEERDDPERDKNATTRGRFVWSAWTGQHSVEDITETRESLKLMGFVVGVFVLVALHVARLVRQVLSTSDSFASTTLVETLLMRARVLADVRQSVHCGGCFPSLKEKYSCNDRIIIVKQNKLYKKVYSFMGVS